MPARSLCTLACLLILGAGGCWPGQRPGGSQSSVHEFTYESTIDMPQSVQLRDLATGTVIWQYDVPIGQVVVIRFQDNYNPSNASRPALMRWQAKARGDEFGELYNVMPAPGSDQRRVETYLRKDTTAVPPPEMVHNPQKPQPMRDVTAKPMYTP